MHLEDHIGSEDHWRFGLKLAVRLGHLATGQTYPFMQFSSRLDKYNISKFIPEVCAIIEKYQEETLICLTTPQDWLAK